MTLQRCTRQWAIKCVGGFHRADEPQLLIPFTDTRQWASFLAGCIGLVMSATPWILFRYGPSIRARVSCLLPSLILPRVLIYSLSHCRAASRRSSREHRAGKHDRTSLLTVLFRVACTVRQGWILADAVSVAFSNSFPRGRAGMATRAISNETGPFRLHFWAPHF